MSASKHNTVTEPMTSRPTGSVEPPPELPPTPGDVETAAARTQLAALRAFCGGLPEGPVELAEPDEGYLPPLLLPFRDPARVRHDYPLLVADGSSDDELCRTVGEVLRTSADTMAPGADEARILKDNLRRLERHVRVATASRGGTAETVDARAVLAEAAEAMKAELGLHGDSAAQLAGDLQRLVEQMPAGRLIDLDGLAPLRLLLAAAAHRAAGRRTALRATARAELDRLRELLRLDRSKAEGGRAEALGQSVDATAGAAAGIDPAAMARLIGAPRGAPVFSPERRGRIEETIRSLTAFLEGPDPPLVTVVAGGPAPEGWSVEHARWTPVDPGEVCAAAALRFDEQARGVSVVLAAIRTGRLEIDDRYDPARHDALRRGFGWESFTTEELGLLPVVVAVETADHLAGAGLRDVSRLLRSGRPVQAIVPVAPASNPGGDEGPLGGTRFEPGYFGLSHREAAVQQSSAARPSHLVDGYLRALDAGRPALHVITSGLTGAGATPPLGAWMHAGAALEGRAHPFFHYDPSAGATWARRFDIGDNPQPEADWPAYELACRGADGAEQQIAVSFTYADYVLLDGGREHFRLIAPGVDPAALRPVAEHVELDEGQAATLVPFIWASDDQGRLHRLAVGRRLMFACRDRLDYWRTLQELAGVRNEHVREAVDRRQRTLEEQFREQRAELEREHAQQIERVRAEAAGQAMEALARSLLGVDPGTLAASALGAAPAAPASSPAAAPAAEPAAPADAEPEPVAEEEEQISAEPWIDSPLCTSCNDCIQINPRLFVYNANKQAMIGDAGAGTYRQIVEAAEKCPARCIHPGLPQNPGEADVEELVERAKPFQ